MENVYIPKEIIVKALWFACSSSSQTYERTLKSRKDPKTHLWRIFSGKLGELFFAYFISSQIKFPYSEYERDALSIFFGKDNVDKYDLKINSKIIDIKTLPEPPHKYLIIPEDQYRNQKKDFYVCIRLHHSLCEEEKEQLFKISCIKLYELFLNPVNTIPKIKAEILGYIPHNSSLWKYVKKDHICREKPCYRIPVENLLPINQLIEILSSN